MSRAGEWQPIDTAPRDGTDILLFQPDVDKHGIERFYHALIIVGFWDDRYKKWSISNVGGFEGESEMQSEEVTHWTPLPKVPK